MGDRPGQTHSGSGAADGVEVRAFETGDEQVFYDLHQEAFRDSWEPIEETYDEWAHQFLVPEVLAPALWTLAVAGEEPAGLAICHPHAVTGELGWVHVLGVRRSLRSRGGLGSRASSPRIRAVPPPGPDARRARGGRDESDRAQESTSRPGCTSPHSSRCTRRPSRELAAGALSELPDVHGGGDRRRLRVPQLREHVLGRDYPRACGVGIRGRGDGRRSAHRSSYPEVAVVERDTLEEQTAAVADSLAPRPIVIGGSAAPMWEASEVSRNESAASASSGSTLTATSTRPRRRRPEIEWGMPFRMIFDGGFVRADDAALVGHEASIRLRPSSWQRPGSTTPSTVHWQGSTPPMSRSTLTYSIQARSTSSSPSRTVLGRRDRGSSQRHRRSRPHLPGWA